jgi:hypothetical protein
MFPFSFPEKVLRQMASPGDRVLDPFCGRGTTNLAARTLGLWSAGIDSNPVAAAITAAKLINCSTDDIIMEAETILRNSPKISVPTGSFWSLAFEKSVLKTLCKFRAAFLQDCMSPERIALRGIILGALHGPVQKTIPGYFSNQSPRTYAPKPQYAVKYWHSRSLVPPKIDALELIRHRAQRFYERKYPATGVVRLGDSRQLSDLKHLARDSRYKWIITSPPYYGMRTYVQDQWLRNWFLGGPDKVDYSTKNQLQHLSPDIFANNLRAVWRNVATVSAKNARLIVRFGGIRDRKINHLDVIKASLRATPWRISAIREAGTASIGKRQADSFLKKKSAPVAEYDIWARMV